MHTRFLYINGRRMPQGFAMNFRSIGSASDGGQLVVAILEDIIKKLGVEIKTIEVDEYVLGRLSACYSWSADRAGCKAPVSDKGAVKNDPQAVVVSYRLPTDVTNSFQR